MTNESKMEYRKEQLTKKLAKFNLNIPADSQLCKDYIQNDLFSTDKRDDLFIINFPDFELERHSYKISCNILKNILAILVQV